MNVYDIADKLLEKLSEEASGSLETLDVNAKTFGNIKTLLKTYKLQPNYDDLMKMSGRKKSNDVSVKFRLKGNELFKDRKYFRALCAYNKSLCFAEARSETLGLAFANRSAVYMEIDEFDLCRENIDLAKRFGYPKNKFNKLDERKKFCLSKQQVKQAGRIFFVLSHNPNSNYPFIADCLSLKQCFKFGRHVVTDETLEIGDVIAIEPPFSSILLSTCIDKRCMKCLGQHKLNLLPCSGCTSAMFCSSECENKANDKFHHIECDFSCEDFDNFFTTAIKAAFRTFLQAFSIFEGSIEKLRQYLMKNVERDLTAFDLNFNKDEVYQRDVILAMNALSTNEEKRQVVEKFRRAIVCTILSEFLQSYSRLKDALRNEENEIFFLSFMFRHIQIAESNYHELYALSPVKLHQDNEQFGVGSFPFSSILNHSCAPNVLRLTFNGFNCIVVSRKIQKGEQVFDNYGFHHALQNLRQRKHGLLKRYQFTCNCRACINNFPLFEQLSEFDEHFDDFIGNDLDSVEVFKDNEAKSAIKRYSEYIEKHIEKYPCYEISLLQECILRCFRVLEKYETKINPKLIEILS